MGKNKNKNGKRINPLANRNVMERESMKMLRNMAFGSFNMYEEGHIFRNPEFVNAALDGINKKLMNLSIVITSIKAATSPQVRAICMDQNVARLLHNYERGYSAYSLMRQCMIDILNSNGDTGYLLVLVNKLPDYKYNI